MMTDKHVHHPDPHCDPTPAPPPVVTPHTGEGAATVSGLLPPSAAVGDPSFVLRVLGAGFTEESVIVFGGVDEPTTFFSEGELTTVMNMDVWLGPDPAIACEVRTGLLLSNTVTFEMQPARPVPLDPAYASQPTPKIDLI
jgi:hypothetical protein